MKKYILDLLNNQEFHSSLQGQLDAYYDHFRQRVYGDLGKATQLKNSIQGLPNLGIDQFLDVDGDINIPKAILGIIFNHFTGKNPSVISPSSAVRRLEDQRNNGWMT